MGHDDLGDNVTDIKLPVAETLSESDEDDGEGFPVEEGEEEEEEANEGEDHATRGRSSSYVDEPQFASM